MCGPSAIRMEAVSKWYGKKPGLLDCSIAIPEGKITAFIGNNGAGKTTTLKLIMGFLRPTAGKVFVEEKLRTMLTVNRSLGYLPEVLRFPELYSVGHFFESLAGTRGLRYKEVKDYLEKAREMFALGTHWKKSLRSCSKGTRQKVGIIQAFLHSPRLVVMDEPTTGLDPTVRHSFFQFLNSQRDQGVSIVISSHNLQEIESQADHYIFFHENRIVESVTAKKMVERTGACIIVSGDFPEALHPELTKLNALYSNSSVLLQQKEHINAVLALLISHNLIIENIIRDATNLEQHFLDIVAEGSKMA